MRKTLAIAFIVLSASTVAAAQTEWQELAPDTRMRLIADEQRSNDGKTFLALELEMPSNTKTYWRVPGETGIPLLLNFAGSQGVADSRVVWPFPKIETLYGFTDFVLYGRTVLPIELEVGEASRVSVALQALMGICSDICVPADAKFDLTLDFSAPDAANAVRIEQALVKTPLDWTDDNPPVRAVAIDAATGTLQVAVDPTRLDPTTLIADASESGYAVGAPKKGQETNIVAYDLLGGGDIDGLVGETISFVFMTGDGPYEVKQQVATTLNDG